MAQTQRAPFPNDLLPLRIQLKELLPILCAEKDWYGSIFFERKSAETFVANLKQTQVSENVVQGVVLRIYDGYTLFEQATDELETDALRKFAQAFAARVRDTRPPEGATKRPYQAPTWKQRLASPLESEIASQVPVTATAGTLVHFGIRFIENPVVESAAQRLDRLKAMVARVQALAPAAGFQPEDLTYIMARMGIAQEDSIFVDSETDMSQSLYRISLTVILMSGSDRVFLRAGGLGGLEAMRIEDEELNKLLKDLHALKGAGRLEPGKYRVLMGPVLTGVLAHEAFGHSQEADTCARGRSKAWELHKSGATVGNSHATILNNPAIFESGDQPYAAWGSYFFDEEGWLAEEQVLLDQGQLKAPMTNLTSALRLGIPRTANGKRESWANGVYTRQTNTYFSAGNSTLEQLMTDLGDGFLALHPAGGMEDPKGMGIQVGISYLQEVKGGKPTGRVFKGPAGGDIQMTGYTPDILNSIVGKSKIETGKAGPDKARHPHNDVGGCGKYHKEFVYAGCGGTYMLLDQVILG